MNLTMRDWADNTVNSDRMSQRHFQPITMDTLTISTMRFGMNQHGTRLPGRIIGDIGLLLVTPDSYHIIDYKTNDTSVRSIDDLVKKYRPQLEAYAAALYQNDDSRTVQTTLYFPDADKQRTPIYDTSILDNLNAKFNKLVLSTGTNSL